MNLPDSKSFNNSDLSILSLSQLQTLVELSVSLNRDIETKSVLKSALSLFAEEVKAEGATIFVLNELSSELIFWAIAGDNEKNLEGLKMPSDQGVAGWVVQNDESVLIDDVYKDERFFSEVDDHTKFKTKNLLCLPLSNEKEVFGAIQIVNKQNGSFFNEDVAFAKVFASMASLAINNMKLVENLEKKNKRLISAEKRKNDTISIISHEFKTPLNLIQNAVNLLVEGTLDETTTRDISAMLRRGMSRINRLMSEVRELFLTQSEDFNINLKDIKVGEITTAVEAQYAHVAERRGLNFIIDIHDPHTKVIADPELCKLVLYKLVANAIRYTPEGGSIKLSTKKSFGLVGFYVQDSGVGIEDMDLDLIFDKFYEGGNLLNHSSGDLSFLACGLGLGLATVRAILEAHKSSIHVKSEIGKGSEFSFSLHAAKG